MSERGSLIIADLQVCTKFIQEVLLGVRKEDLEKWVQITAHLLNKEHRKILISIVDKYLEWNEKAISKEVTLEKIIEIDLVVRGVYKSLDEWYWSCNKPSSLIIPSFLSQNTKRHQLILSFGKIQSCSNEYMDHKPDQLYIDYEEALIIKQLLTQESIDKTIQEYEKQKSIEDDFKQDCLNLLYLFNLLSNP